jgi:hypothetical protein
MHLPSATQGYMSVQPDQLVVPQTNSSNKGKPTQKPIPKKAVLSTSINLCGVTKGGNGANNQSQSSPAPAFLDDSQA